MQDAPSSSKNISNSKDAAASATKPLSMSRMRDIIAKLHLNTKFQVSKHGFCMVTAVHGRGGA